MAVENDMMKGRMFKEKLVLKAGAAEGVGGEGRTKPALTIEDRSLRSCCQNVVVVSVLTLEECVHQRISDIITVCGQPFEKQSTALKMNTKSIEATSKWRKEQWGQRGYMKHVEEFILHMENKAALAACGFSVTSASEYESVFEDNCELFTENEFADIFAGMDWAAVRNRLRRQLYLFGWP